MKIFNGHWVSEASYRRMIEAKDQLELQFGLTVIELAEAGNENNRLRLELAEAHKLMAQLADAAERERSDHAVTVNQLQLRIDQLTNRRRDDLGRFAREISHAN